MTDQEENGNTELVLPIICPNCKHEIDLGMVFSLLPPKEESNPLIKSHEPTEEEE